MPRTIHFQVVGCISGPDHAVQPGIQVKVVSTGGNQILASGFTGEGGRYRLAWRFRGRRWAWILKLFKILPARISVLVLSADGKVAGQRAGLKVMPGEPLRCDLELSAAALAGLQPTAAPLPRLSGPLVSRDGLGLIDAAISMLVPPGQAGHNRLKKAARMLLPEAARFGELLDDTWGALDGDPAAAARLRGTLELFAQRLSPEARSAIPQIKGKEWGAAEFAAFREFASPGALRSLRSEKRMRADSPGTQSLPPERYLPVAAAILMIADSPGDAAWLMAGMKAGLCGLDRYEGALDSAGKSLAGGKDHGLIDTLAYHGSQSGLDDSPIPDGPDFSPTRSCDWRPDHPIDEVPLPEMDGFLRGSGEYLLEKEYVIASITPDNACLGYRVTLTGQNFGGSRDSVVCFQRAGSATERTYTTPLSWSDTEIQVIVPEEAGPGSVTLQIFSRVAWVNNQSVTIYRQGQGIDFKGGAAQVTSLSVDGRSDAVVCVEPNTSVTLAWTSFWGPITTGTVDIEIRDANGGLTYAWNGQPPSGSVVYTIDSRINVETDQTVYASVFGHCGTNTRSLKLRVTIDPILKVENLEITQGIQTFDMASFSGNALTTVAGKDTIVRAYISSDRRGFNSNRTPDVSGKLTIGEVTLLPINGNYPTAPHVSDPFITAFERDSIMRDNDRVQTSSNHVDHTLNFKIPAYLASGTKQLRLHVFSENRCGAFPSTDFIMNWIWHEHPALRVRFVRIEDRRGNRNSGPIASEDEARFTLERALDLLPSPATDIGPARVREMWTDVDYNADPFESGAGVATLLGQLIARRRAGEVQEAVSSVWGVLTGDKPPEPPHDENEEWIGLTPSTRNAENRGMANGVNTCVADTYTLNMGQDTRRRITPAHELSHNRGFRHVKRICRGGLIFGPFDDHPNLGDLQEIPFDPYWNQVVGTGVGSVQDYMSYGCTVWVSEHSWPRLLGAT